MNVHQRRINKAYIEIALNLGVAEFEQALENTNLSLAVLEQCDYVDVSAAVQMVHNVEKYSEDSTWPVKLGSLLGTSSHGPVGYATLSAPSVGKALTTFSQWFQLRSDVYKSSVIETVDAFEIVITDTTEDALFKFVFFSAFVRALEVLVELLLAKFPGNGIDIYFQTREIPSKEKLKAAYLSSLHFDHVHNTFQISKDIWYKRSPLHDQESYEFNLHTCQRLLDEQAQQGRLDIKIKHMLNRHFDRYINSSDEPCSPPTLQEVCQTFYMTERTLIRKLKEHNTSYQSIVDKQRLAYAKQLLGDARYSVFHVSELLGYREPANFCRAFKRWTSLTPSEFRRQPR